MGWSATADHPFRLLTVRQLFSATHVLEAHRMPARRTVLRLSALALTLSTALGATAQIADARTGSLPTGRAVGAEIEAPASYQGQFLCKKAMQPGVRAFRTLILKTYK